VPIAGLNIFDFWNFRVAHGWLDFFRYRIPFFPPEMSFRPLAARDWENPPFVAGRSDLCSSDTEVAMAPDRLIEAGKVGTTLCGVIILLGCIMCTMACPSQELIAAVSFEAALMVAVVYWRHLRKPVAITERKAQVLSWLRGEFPRTFWLQSFWHGTVAVTCIAAFVLISIEFTAFSLCAAGQRTAGENVYTVSPLSRWLSNRPAHSLEYLAGAYSQYGNYAAARPLYNSILHVRERCVADDHESLAEIWTDIGVLCAEHGDYEQSERALRKSLALATKAANENRAGRALTLLGNTLCERGKLREAEAMYTEALSMRTKKFGADSLKVAETLREYSLLLRYEKRTAEMKAVESRLWKILQLHRSDKEEVSPQLVSMLSILIAGASWFFFGPVAPIESFARFALKRKAKRTVLSDEEKELSSMLGVTLAVALISIEAVHSHMQA
jgi:tetratricopeptide (TPR) repeat protein